MEFAVKFLQIADPSDRSNIDKFLNYLIDNSIVDERLVSVGQSPALKNYDSVMLKLFRLYLAGDIAGFTKLLETDGAAIAALSKYTTDCRYQPQAVPSQAEGAVHCKAGCR